MNACGFAPIEFSTQFIMGLLTITVIDIILAGDNAVVIAMAVKNLPSNKRFKGIIFGSLAAVILRVIFTFIASQLLLTPLIKLAGGALILWIAVKLLEDDCGKNHDGKCTDSLWKAVWIIIVADFTMSLDNVLAVAGASHGNIYLLLFGLGLSIPLVVFTSSLLSRLMDKYPVIMWIGAAVLGKVAGEMIVSDTIVVSRILEPLHLTHIINNTPHPLHHVTLFAEIFGVLAVLLFSWIKMHSKKTKSI